MNEKESERTLMAEITIETASAKIRDIGISDEPEDYELDIWAGVMPLKQVTAYPIPNIGKPEKIKISQHVLDYYEQNKS